MNDPFDAADRAPDAGAADPYEVPATLGEKSYLLLVAGAIIVVDHLSKLFIESWLPLNRSWVPFESLGQYLRITHVSNTGAAFGLFQNNNTVFMIVAILVGLVIIIYNHQLPAHQRLFRLALGMQLGGALGNLIDRFRLGHVTDFVDVGPWPVFNVADASIVAGVVVLALLMFIEGRNELRQQAAERGHTAEEAAEERPMLWNE